jgi:hypothetical protein
MEPNLQKSEQLSDIVQHPSNAELPVNKPSDGTIKEPEAKHQAISLTVQGSQLSLPLGKWVVLGVVMVALVATFFLVTRGNDFCLFSSCDEYVTRNPIATNFWAFAGAAGAGWILASLGVAFPLVVLGSFGIWFLMEISLH